MVDANIICSPEALQARPIGMVTRKELDLNLKIFNDQEIKP
jgi:hypothetical protein